MNMDDLDRQLWEIDENLMRAELGPAEMAEHLKRRKNLREAREKKVAQVEPPTGQKKRFATGTEAKTGTSKATTNRAVARATAIPTGGTRESPGPRSHLAAPVRGLGGAGDLWRPHHAVPAVVCLQEAYQAALRRFLRHPMKPSNARPVPKRGSAAGRGTRETVAIATIPVWPVTVWAATPVLLLKPMCSPEPLPMQGELMVSKHQRLPLGKPWRRKKFYLLD